MDKSVYIHTCPECSRRFWHTICDATNDPTRNVSGTHCASCSYGGWDKGMGEFHWCDEFKDWAVEVRKKAGVL